MSVCLQMCREELQRQKHSVGEDTPLVLSKDIHDTLFQITKEFDLLENSETRVTILK